MDPPTRPGSAALFQVYLRLRPPHSLKGAQKQQQHDEAASSQSSGERFIAVESPAGDDAATADPAFPTHITINPPTDSRKRAVEKFGFTRVFEETTTQLQIFEETGHVDLINGVVQDGQDGLMATLGVTGSGKSHTILGTKSQRGITQLTLDYLFRSLGSRVVHPILSPSLMSSLDSADPSEAQLLAASNFLDTIYGDGTTTRAQSRAATPAVVNTSSTDAMISSPESEPKQSGLLKQWSLLGLDGGLIPPSNPNKTELRATRVGDSQSAANIAAQRATQKNVTGIHPNRPTLKQKTALWSHIPFARSKGHSRVHFAGSNSMLRPDQEIYVPQASRRNTPAPPRPASFPTQPSLKNIQVQTAPNADFAVVVSMYEVYNDRIFDLLQTNSPPPNARGERQRRALLFKSTEGSPDRKIVAGLQKVVCGSYEEAMMVLETGLTERRVAGTGSNSTSSRSHGFFVLEVKRRDGRRGEWRGGALTIVDLAGSERAKTSKTAGSALAEAGKINESLMYLGQCLQMQSDMGSDGSSGGGHGGGRAGLVPFRQCKLTELLFANSPVGGGNNHNHNGSRSAQKSVMLVTADPLGDFNATSQILRYSALAREITVPRIPSVASTVPFAPGPTGATGSGGSRPGTAENRYTASSGSNGIFVSSISTGRISPDSLTTASTMGDLVAARGEAERLSDELAILALRLAEEQVRRREAESSWVSAQERMLLVEREVRDECCDEMERRLAEEKRRWTLLRDEERDQADEDMDRKIELLEGDKSEKTPFRVHEDSPQPADERVRELEAENASLRARLEATEREALTRSPTKTAKTTMVPKTPFRTPFKSPAKKSSLFGAGGKENLGLVAALGKLDISAGEVGGDEATSRSRTSGGIAAPLGRSPGKKLRRLTPRERIFDDEDALGEDEDEGGSRLV